MFALITKTHTLRQFLRHFFTAKRRGHGVHSPFAYRLCEEVLYSKDVFYDFAVLQQIREELLHDKQLLEVDDYGAGSKTFNGKKRLVKNIVKKGISTRRQSEFIYRLINFLNSKNCLEIGTSLGLNALYMAKANQAGRVTTVEGSYVLWKFAVDLGSRYHTPTINYLHGTFDAILPELLNSSVPFDFIYIDGNHTYEATLRYFKMGLLKNSESSVFMIDDVYWSPDMTKAWNEIKSNPLVSMSIDCFYFGLVFFNREIKEKVDLTLYF
ncbi:MAG: class I SAM-dependent methyltransferase [bacterium]|nr:class I SAM-dependent methyltransferase [bacterium]